MSAREALLHAVVADAGLPASFAQALVVDCPWLDDVEGLGEEIGTALLVDVAAGHDVDPALMPRLVGCYSDQIWAAEKPLRDAQSAGYDALLNASQGEGRQGVFAGCDYWLMEDSFSSRSPVILLFDGFRFSEQILNALQQTLSDHAAVFDDLHLNDEEGDPILKLIARG